MLLLSNVGALNSDLSNFLSRVGIRTSFTSSVNALARHFLACVDFVFVLEAQLAAQDSPGWTLDRQHGEVDAKESWKRRFTGLPPFRANARNARLPS